MSRQYPIYVTSSEEDPSEGDYDSDASVHEEPLIHPRVTSDDSTVDTDPIPPTVPMTTPTTARATAPTTTDFHQAAETSRGPVLRRTPRMCVRDFPRGPLAPREKAPMVEPETLPEEPPQKRLRSTQFDWMPHLLREWRSLEGIPSTYETGESSHTPPPVSLTGEPLELTVPTLVAVIHTLFRMSSSRSRDIMELQSDVSRLDGDMRSTYERYDFLFGNMVAAREIAESARTRLRMLERRARVAGIVAGVCLMMAALTAAVGLYLPYFR